MNTPQKNPSTTSPSLRKTLVMAGTALLVCLAAAHTTADPVARMRTVAGDIFINLSPENAPLNVQNFQNYAEAGEYNSSFIHRSARSSDTSGQELFNFVIQGGGFRWLANENGVREVITTAPVVNEFNVSNLRGTVAMAKPANSPDGATSQWFINLDDRNEFLDTNTGGFTVIGTVDERGMQVADSIANLITRNENGSNVGGPFGEVPVLNPNAVTDRNNLVIVNSVTLLDRVPAPAAAVLPASRTIQVGETATGFATLVNSGTSIAAGCTVAPASELPATFVYRQTNPATNEAFGVNNPVLDVPAEGAASVVFSITPTEDIASTPVSFSFECGNAAGSAALTPGVNTFDLSASTTPSADVVALAGTTSADGINNIPSSAGSGAFVVATVNLGSEEAITVSADTGSASLPVGLFVCPTDAATGACTSPAAVSATQTMPNNNTGTFAVFAQLTDSEATVDFDPARNRAFVRFRTASGALRGSTSVALRTVP